MERRDGVGAAVGRKPTAARDSTMVHRPAHGKRGLIRQHEARRLGCETCFGVVIGLIVCMGGRSRPRGADKERKCSPPQQRRAGL
jgi:hypothetical protein